MCPQEQSHFAQEVVQGAEMAEDNTILTAQTGTDSEFSGFKPVDLNMGAISDPN